MKKLSFLFILVLLSGCMQKTPLEKLADDQKHPELTTTFWVEECDHNTLLWKQAFDYCKTHQTKINCSHVLEIYFFLGGHHKLMTLEEGHQIKEPNL